jgi:hypothetical protein
VGNKEWKFGCGMTKENERKDGDIELIVFWCTAYCIPTLGDQVLPTFGKNRPIKISFILLKSLGANFRAFVSELETHKC